MSRLYVTPLPDSQAISADEGVRAQIQQSGLLQAGGTATEKIAQDNIDLVVSGQFRKGARFSRKLADELSSIGESDYSGLPLFRAGVGGGGKNAGYYEVESVDVSPPQPVTEEVFEYEVSFTFTDTKENVWTSVETTIEDVETGLATGSNSLIGLPASAGKVRWFSEASGKENATASSTVSAEFGDVDLYDPQDTSVTNPILLYELDYSETGNVDVRVYDDRNLSKYYSVGGEEFSQWTHAYHTSYEYEGAPVVDNGLLRVRFDESNGVVEAYEWNNSTSTWDTITVNMGDYQLVDADFESISPVDTRVFTEWYDTVDDRLEQALLSFQRGLSGAIARYPDGTTQTSGLESVLSPFVVDYSTDVKPSRALKARGEVK